MSSASDGNARTVLYVIDGLGLSGKTKSLVELACGLDTSRWRAEVCCFDAKQSPLEARLRSHGIVVHKVECRDGLNLGAVRRLKALIRTVRPDVVHCYNPRAMLYGAIAARLTGTRAVVGSLSAFGCLVPDQPYDFLPQPLLTRRARHRLRNRLIVGMMRRLLVVSGPLGERFCRYNGIAPDKLEVIPYSVDLVSAWKIDAREVATFRQSLGAGAGDVLVGSVGRLVEQKDYPTQLKAMGLALKEAPSLRMVFAGAGPLGNSLQEMADRLGIAGRVQFIGHCDRVAMLLRCLDVFVMTSQFEPYGVAVIEAKAAGLPVVATAVGEMPGLISEGRSGLLVEPKSPEALANALVRVARNAALRRKLAAESLREARERHDLRRALTRYQELYDTVWHETHHKSSRRQSNAATGKTGSGVLECHPSVVHSAE